VVIVVTAETEVQITLVQGDNKMKGIFFLMVFGIGLTALTGCYTVPRHYTQQVEIIYYVPVEPPYAPDPIIDYPPPPPSPPVYYSPAPEPPNQPKDRQPEKPRDSYNQRDPLQGGDHRGSGETKTDPPVRNPVQKDRDRQ
jgi:hypothetical protein